MIKKLHVICKLKIIRREVKREKRVLLGPVWNVGLGCISVVYQEWEWGGSR
jgi:hypothetical protein